MANEEAEILMLISGEVQLKQRGAIKKLLTEVGTVMGEEPLLNQPYQFTAVCVSASAQVLSISLADYITQFVERRSRRPGRASSNARASSNTLASDIAALRRRSSIISIASPLVEEGRRSLAQEETHGQTVQGQKRLSRTPRPSLNKGHRRRSSDASARALREIAAGHPFHDTMEPDELDALADSIIAPTRLRQDKCKLIEREWQLLQDKQPPGIVAPPNVRDVGSQRGMLSSRGSGSRRRNQGASTRTQKV